MTHSRHTRTTRVLVLLSALLLLLLALGVGAATSSADITFCPAGSGAGQCSGAEGLASDFSEGRVYVADKGNNRVDVFTAETGAFLFSFGQSLLSTPQWVAVDNSAGPSRHDVYVTDSQHRVLKFDKDGNFLRMFGAGVNTGTSGKPNLCTNAGPPTDVCGPGTAGTGAGQLEELRGVGVSGAGTVYVVDTKNLGSCAGDLNKGSEFLKRVHKYSEAGEASEELTLTDVPCGRVRGFAVESGGSFWVASEGSGRAVRRYLATATTSSCTKDEGIETQGIGVDEANRLFAAQSDGGLLPVAVSNTVVTEFEAGACPGYARRFGYGRIEGSSTPTGLAALHTATGDVMVSQSSGGIAYLKGGGSGPIAIGPETPSLLVGNTKATVRAFVNPEGKATQYRFQFVDQADYEANQLANGNGFIGTGVGETTAKALALSASPPSPEWRVNPTGNNLLGCEVAGANPEAEGCLAPSTTYHWRVLATNADNPTGTGEAAVEGTPFTTKAPLESEVFMTGAGTESAKLSAWVNPLGIPSTGYFEYVSEADYEADKAGGGDGFKDAIKVPDPGAGEAELDFGKGEAPVKRSRAIAGLAEGGSYRYRLIAKDPFFAGIPSETKALTTYRAPEVERPCPNEAFRTGASAALPDCRTYELVSPLDKEGGDIIALLTNITGPARLDQSSGGGERLAYSTLRAFGDAASAPYTSQYIAARGAGGWQSHAINPPKGRVVVPQAITDNEYFHFSEDLCEGTLVTLSEAPASGPLAPEEQPGYFNMFRRTDELCGGPVYETLSTRPPQHKVPHEYAPLEVQGVSAGGLVTAFATEDNLLESGAPPIATNGTQLYVKAASVAGPPVYACVLPDGTTVSSCSAGSGGGTVPLAFTRNASVKGALSEDGSRVFWSDSAGSAKGLARIYVRENPLAPESVNKDGEGNCVPEAGKACTIAVSKAGEAESGVSNQGKSHFWAGAANGSAALFDVASASGNDLYEFTVAGKETHKVAGKALGVIGASSDLERVYFASSEAIAGSGKDGLGGEAVAGKPNLYFYEAGEGGPAYRFLGVLNGADTGESPMMAPIAFRRSSQVSADGLTAAFVSSASLTSFDNTDASSPEACGGAGGKGICDSEVFLYDAAAKGGEGELVCVSCNPAGGRPEGTLIDIPAHAPIWVAGQLPFFETTLYQPRALAPSGDRLFFESQDPLSPRDANGKLDVYEWERAGAGGCDEGDPAFHPSVGGCVSLISSGQSNRDSELLDADTSGRNVFFATLSGLLPYDPDSVDVYDARVGGGLPEPEGAGAGCEGEACQGPYAPPEAPIPASALFHGAGNEKPGSPARSRKCKKGQAKRKGRCVKPRSHKKKHKRHHKQQKRANSGRGGAK